MWRWGLALVVIASSVARAQPAAPEPAQPPEPQAPASAPAPAAPVDATTMFEQGRALAKEGKYAEACESFSISLSLDTTAIGTQLNLADCYEHLGQLARAWHLFHEAAGEFEIIGEAERASFARERAVALDAKLATVVVRIGEPNVLGAIITINGQPATPAAEISERVDPGDVVVVVTLPGKPPLKSAAQVVAGETLRVDASGEREQRATDRGARAIEIDAGRRRSYVLAAVGLGAAGGIEIVTALVLGVSARNRYEAAISSDCMRADVLTCNPLGAAKVRDAQHLADLATWFGVGGLALASGAAVVYYFAPREVRIAPTASSGALGLTAIGRF